MQHAIAWQCVRMFLSINRGLVARTVFVWTHLLRGHGVRLLCADGEGKANHSFDLAQLGLVFGLDSGFHSSTLVVENPSVYRLSNGSDAKDVAITVAEP